MTVQQAGLAATISAVLDIDPDAPAIEFDERWHTWGQLARTARSVAATVGGDGVEVGVILRNDPVSVGLLLGVVLGGGCVVAINPDRGLERTRADIAALQVPFVAGLPGDLAALVPDECDTTTIGVAELGAAVTIERTAGGGRGGRSGVAVRMLTSGTTGPPKRVDLGYDLLERVLVGAKHYESTRSGGLSLRRGVAVVNAPLAHVSGLFRVLQCATDGRSFALLPRFTVEGWASAVRRHRPATASLVPAALRMVLDADLDPADLASLRSVVSGTAPLDPDDADAFFRRYGVPVLISYGATEFGGGVAGWNIDDHRAFWSAKRGSVGRAHAGCELRIVDPDSGELVPSGGEGLLEVKSSPNEPWARTTDLARVDADGFLWILGRADEAIIRGGFKIIPDDVRVALERHPSVRGAAVLGRPDRRLGAVPVAVVELWADRDPADGDDLARFIAPSLSAYEIPTEIRIVDELPRTDSGKVDLRAAAVLLADGASVEG